MQVLDLYLPIEPVEAILIEHIQMTPANQPSAFPGGSWLLGGKLANGGEFITEISNTFYNFYRPEPGAYLVRRKGYSDTIVSSSAFLAYHKKLEASTSEAAQLSAKIPLDIRTKMQVAVLLLSNGTDKQKQESLEFLAGLSGDDLRS